MGIGKIIARYSGGAIERRIELKVPGVPVPVLGFIDVMLEGGIPGDFKTSSKSWGQDKAKGELQSLYYLAALIQLGEAVPDGQFMHFVFIKTKTPQYQEFSHCHRPGEMLWLFGMIHRVWMAIDDKHFPENPGSWKCSPVYCDFWKLCRGKYL